MNSFSGKTQINKSSNTVNTIPQKKNGILQFEDKRVVASDQKILQEITNHSNQVNQLKNISNLKNVNKSQNGVLQRVKWDTVKDAPNNYKTEIFGGVSWRKYLVQTDAGTFIEVFKGENEIGAQSESGYGQMMMKGSNSGLFNCHGFTFGGYAADGGPYGILDAGPVRQILADEYQEQEGPSMGCVVVFGDANHSGIVEGIEKGTGDLDQRVMVRSKLGTKSFSVESIKALSRFGKARYYTKGGIIKLENTNDLEIIEEQAREIEERALEIREIEKGVEDIHRLQIILAKLMAGNKPTEEEMEFFYTIKQEMKTKKQQNTKASKEKQTIDIDGKYLPKDGTYDSQDLSNEEILAIVNQGLMAKRKWAIDLAVQTNYNGNAIVKLMKESNTRFTIKNGQAYLRLRGG